MTSVPPLAHQWELWRDTESRLLLVITPDYRNRHWPTVMVVPVLSMSLGIPSPGMVELGNGGHAKCDVIATIGHERLVELQGELDEVDRDRVRRGLRTTLGL